MRFEPLSSRLVALLLAVTAAAVPGIASAQAPPAAAPEHVGSTIEIPKSVQAEHEAIHRALVEATQAPGGVGAAAKELAALLDPHFRREEQIALPPLGLLEALAAGKTPPEAADALAMSDALRTELPRMMAEHQQIRAAVEKLRTVARAEHAAQAEELADELALHAQTEEEVLYPAAILVGDILRAREVGS